MKRRGLEFTEEMVELCETIEKSEDIEERKRLMLRLADSSRGLIYDPTDDNLSEEIIVSYELIEKYETKLARAKFALSRILTSAYHAHLMLTGELAEEECLADPLN